MERLKDKWLRIEPAQVLILIVMEDTHGDFQKVLHGNLDSLS